MAKNSNADNNEVNSRDQSHINFISDKMKTLQVPDNHMDETQPSSAEASKLPPCQYIKDNRLYFHEVKLRAENHNAVAEKMVFFRNFRAQLENTLSLNQAIEIPPIYVDLIAALVQDSDEASASTLAGRINELLSPFLRKEQLARKFHHAIETVINQIAYKCIYGLRPEVYANLIADQQQPQQQTQQQSEQPEQSMPPQHLCLTRWEVHNLDFFPSDMRQAVNARRLLRQMMTDSVSQYLCDLPKAARQTLLFPPSKKQRQSRQSTEQRHPNPQQQKQQPEAGQTVHIETEEEKEKRLKKEEEKRKKEEEKRQREEEKKRREEEKRRKEEERRKKEQSQLRLTSLFAKQMSAASASTSTPSSSVSNHSAMEQEQRRLLEPSKPTIFPPFYIKENVTIFSPHPLINQTKNSCTITNTADGAAQDEFRNHVQSASSCPDPESLRKDFLDQLSPESKQKRGVINTQVDIRTLLLPGSADLMTIPNVRLILKMKLFQFDEDVRPAYYGTWTNKKSHIISNKRPLAKDTVLLDYDVDSEAEWEPEDAEGEDIHSGDEQDDAEDNDIMDPEDIGWLVPEGYLSDSEGVDDDGEEDFEKIRYQRGAHTQKKTRPTIRKIVLGPFFEGDESNSNSVEDEAFKLYEAHLFIDAPKEGYDPFRVEPSATNSTTSSGSTAYAENGHNTTSTTSTTTHKVEFTDVHKNALISVINEKPAESIPNLIQEAKANSVLKDMSKRQLELNIKNIAVKEKRGSDKKPSWYIKDNAVA